MNRRTGWSLTLPLVGLVCYWTLCFLLTHIPMSGALKSQIWHMPHQDKVVHLILYAGLAWLLVWVLEEWTHRPNFARFGGFVIAVAYGGVDEWLQSFIPSRSMDGFDWLADTLGSAVGVTGYVIAGALFATRARLARTVPTV